MIQICRKFSRGPLEHDRLVSLKKKKKKRKKRKKKALKKTKPMGRLKNTAKKKSSNFLFKTLIKRKNSFICKKHI